MDGWMALYVCPSTAAAAAIGTCMSDCKSPIGSREGKGKGKGKVKGKGKGKGKGKKNVDRYTYMLKESHEAWPTSADSEEGCRCLFGGSLRQR